MNEEELREYVHALSKRLAVAERRIYRHSVFAYPHFWLWHALFDGTWLCRCWHSQEYKSHRSKT